MRYVKLWGLAAIAAMALMSFATVAIAADPFALDQAQSPELGLALLSVSFITLGAFAPRIGTTRQFSLSTLLTNCRLTVNKTHNSAINTVTVDSQMRDAAFTTRRFANASDDAACEPIAQSENQLPNPHYDREALPNIPVMAC